MLVELVETEDVSHPYTQPIHSPHPHCAESNLKTLSMLQFQSVMKPKIKYIKLLWKIFSFPGLINVEDVLNDFNVAN